MIKEAIKITITLMLTMQIATANVLKGNAVPTNEIPLIAKNVYFEANHFVCVKPTKHSKKSRRCKKIRTEEQRIKSWENATWVILNRLNDEQFPRTVRQIIYQQGQFSWVSDRRPNVIPKKDRALYTAITHVVGKLVIAYNRGHIGDPLHGAVFYNNRLTSKHMDYFNTLRTVAFDGDHTYYVRKSKKV